MVLAHGGPTAFQQRLGGASQAPADQGRQRIGSLLRFPAWDWNQEGLGGKGSLQSEGDRLQH